MTVGGDHGLLFLRKLLTRGTQVAAVTPSSRALAQVMASAVDPTREQVIVELGAGTGAVTIAATGRLHPKSRLVAVEIDEELAAVARRAAPRAEVVVGDAGHLSTLLAPLDLPRVDVVLSGLPVPSFGHAVRVRLFGWLAEHPAATFHQLTVMPWIYAPLYRSWFRDVTFELVVRNLPPGGVYHCARLW